jgi:hypothetical protein
MPDIPVDTHTLLLAALRVLQSDLRALRESVEIRNAYVGFDIAEGTLRELRAAIADRRDRDQIVTWLKKADGIYELMGGGEVAPIAQNIRGTLRSWWEELEALPPRLGP